jgi:hypothetical protein
MTTFLRHTLSGLLCASLFSTQVVAQMPKPPAASTVAVKLRVVKSPVFKVEDLLLSLSVSNTSGKPVRMLFDKPYRTNFGPWMTRCVVKNSKGDTIQRMQHKLLIERKEWTPVEMESFRFDLRAQDWVLRLYALTDLMIFDEKKYDKTGRLPSGTYSVQVFFYDIPSNVVTFELRNPPAPVTPVTPAKPAKKESRMTTSG